MSEEDVEVAPYNDGFTHEALHMTLFFMETFEEWVLCTRCAEEFPDVKLAAEKIADQLGDLYQLIGSK